MVVKCLRVTTAQTLPLLLHHRDVLLPLPPVTLLCQKPPKSPVGPQVFLPHLN